MSHFLFSFSIFIYICSSWVDSKRKNKISISPNLELHVGKEATSFQRVAGCLVGGCFVEVVCCVTKTNVVRLRETKTNQEFKIDIYGN